jgi:hypothetical protein
MADSHDINRSVGYGLGPSQIKGSRSVKSHRRDIQIHEMLETGMKTFFNEHQPKFNQPKHYRARDTMLKDVNYKIHSHAINKRDTKDSFFEQVIRKTNCCPAQYYKTNNIYDWSNNFKGRGKIMKSDKITHTAEVQKVSKKMMGPSLAPGTYPFKEYIGKEGPIKSGKGTVALERKECGFIEEAKWHS